MDHNMKVSLCNVKADKESDQYVLEWNGSKCYNMIWDVTGCFCNKTAQNSLRIKWKKWRQWVTMGSNSKI